MSENKPHPRLEADAQFGKCVIRDLIGRGKNTEVYRAFYAEFKKDVALKILRPNIPHTPERAACYRQEAQAVADLKHPNILRIHEYGVERDAYYVVMEFIEGSNLRDLLSTHPTGLDRNDAMRIFSQLASAVATAHDHGVAHGNIKPDNVLLDRSQRPVLTDFTIPCLIERAGNPLSTPAYLAPEQATQRAATPPSDIYALGILLYEMVTGDVPFKGTTFDAVIAQHQSAPPTPPSQITIGLDPRIESVILKALRKAPAERFASAREMLSAIESGEVAGQYETLALKREQVRPERKRQSEIKRFEQARLGDPMAPTADSTPASRDLSPAFVALGLALLVLLAIALAALLL
jgi:serine/threonine-protein kinase